MFPYKIEFPVHRFWMSNISINDRAKASGVTVDCEILLDTANVDVKSFAEKVGADTRSFYTICQLKCT